MRKTLFYKCLEKANLHSTRIYKMFAFSKNFLSLCHYKSYRCTIFEILQVIESSGCSPVVLNWALQLQLLILE